MCELQTTNLEDGKGGCDQHTCTLQRSPPPTGHHHFGTGVVDGAGTPPQLNVEALLEVVYDPPKSPLNDIVLRPMLPVVLIRYCLLQKHKQQLVGKDENAGGLWGQVMDSAAPQN